MGWRLLSFDLDGTLVDTAPEIAVAANRTLADFGFPAQSLSAVANLIGHGAHHLMRRLLNELGAAPTPDTLASLLRCFDRHYADTAGTIGVSYPRALESLRLLQANGLRLACVTNKAHRYAHHVLTRHGLANCFELLIGGDSLPWAKPHAGVLRHVATALGGSITGMAHVGDSATDIEAARNAGVAAWAVSYGYNAGQAIALSKPDALFADLWSVAQAALGRAGPLSSAS